jgi:hypothetical protein
VALTDWERRPPDDGYYELRTEYVRQGDIFRDVPLGYPWPPDAVDHEAGSRKFLAGPFEPGFGLLLTPTCSMTAQGAPGHYSHPVRMLAPVLPLEHLIAEKAIKAGAVDDLRERDHLINYFYVPAITEAALPESVALLYAAITVHHDYLDGRRMAQLSQAAAVHLKYKMTALFAGELFSHADFADVAGRAVQAPSATSSSQ